MRHVAEVGAYQVAFYDDSFDLVAGIYKEKNQPKAPKCETIRPGLVDPNCLEAPKIVTTKIRLDSAAAMPVAGGNLAGLANYMIPSGTFMGVERRDEITYPNIYPGIDLRFRFDEEGLLKFDIVVSPGADPGQFGLRATQGARFEIAPDGGFAILSDAGIYRQAKPIVIPDDASVPPEASFYLDHKILRARLDGPAPVSGYVIDPGIDFVSYSASPPDFSVDYSNVNIGNGEFITTGPYTNNLIGPDMNVRVRRWNQNGIVEPDGIFGWTGDEIAAQIAYGEAGGVKRLAVAGWTNSENFLRFNEVQSGLQGGGDGFITVVDFNTLMPVLVPGGFSTYFGGSSPTGAGQGARDENAHSIEFAPGSIEKLYVAGLTNSRDLPVTNAYQGSNRSTDPTGRDAWFAEIDINGGSPVVDMSSYLGGSDDEDFDIRLRTSPSASTYWIDGTTGSDDFFLTPPGGFQPTKGAGLDGFLAEFSPNASAPPTLLGGTYVGGDSDDVIYDLAIRPDADQAVISMKTGSSDMVTTPGAYSSSYSGNDDAFVLEVGPAASSRVLGTYLGGPNFDFAVGVAALPNNRIAIGAGADGLRPTDPGGFPYKNPESPPAPSTENFIDSNAVNPTALILDTTKTGDDQLEFSRCLATRNAWPEELNYKDGKLAVSGQRASISWSGAVASDLPAHNPAPAYDPYHPNNTSSFVGLSWVLDENSYDPFAIRRQTGNVLATSGQPIVIEADIAGSPRMSPTSPPNQTDGSVKIEFTPDGGTPRTYIMGPAGLSRPGIWFGSFVVGAEPGTVRVVAKDGFCEVTRAASRVDLVTDAVTGRITGDDAACESASKNVARAPREICI